MDKRPFDYRYVRVLVEGLSSESMLGQALEKYERYEEMRLGKEVLEPLVMRM